VQADVPIVSVLSLVVNEGIDLDVGACAENAKNEVDIDGSAAYLEVGVGSQ